MNTVLSVGGDVMQPDIPNNFLRLLAEGFENEAEDRQLRLHAVNSYLSLLEKDNVHVPQRFLQVISWVLGEYFFLKAETKPEVVLDKLGRLLDQSSVTSETKGWIMAAITKLSSHTVCPNTVAEVAQKYTTSLDTVLRQHAFELKHLNEDRDLIRRVLPLDASCEDIEVDTSLSFLDGFVADALGRGAAPYKPHHQRQEELSQEKALNYEPYGLSLPVSLSSCSITGRQSPTGLSLSSGLSGNSTEMGPKGGSNSLKLEGVRNVWGKEGYLPQKETTAEGTLQVLPGHEGPSTEESAMENASLQPDLASPTIPEEDQEKQQLASSLFVGLGSHNTLCLVNYCSFVFQSTDIVNCSVWSAWKQVLYSYYYFTFFLKIWTSHNLTRNEKCFGAKVICQSCLCSILWARIENASISIYTISNSLKLEGVRNVWGKEGYLPQKETTAEGTLQVLPGHEGPSTEESAMENASLQPDLASPTIPEEDQEKQQLASSLFVGLGSHNTLCLMGKSENTSQRFRRKTNKTQESSNASEKFSNSSISSRSTVESLMDNNILENTSSEQETELTTLNQSSSQASEFQDSTTPDGLLGLLNQEKQEKQDMSSDPSGQAPSLFTGGDMVILQPSCAAAENEQPPSTGLAHSGVQGLCSNESIAVSACKIYKDDSVVLVVFITNQSTSAIKDIMVRFAPTELKVSESTNHGFPLLEGQNTANCQCSVLMEKPCAQGALVGSIAYQAEPEKSSELQFSIAFALADFIRPLTISTEEYGKLWLAFSNDVKQNLKLLSDAKDPLTATLNALKETLQLHIVDIIEKEANNNSQQAPVFLCFKRERHQYWKPPETRVLIEYNYFAAAVFDAAIVM
ncbi:UNVERIFIED_CONTAM: hypothetical protein FKN15_021636 [Acipenser sinensis]